MITRIGLHHEWAWGGGYLVKRSVQECTVQIGLISASQVYQWPLFYLKIGLDIGLVFAKCLIFDEFSSGLPIGCQKIPMHPNLHGKKYWFVLKKGPSRNKWFRHRLQIFVFSGLVIGWWLKLWAGHPYPNQIWVRPPYAPPPPPNELVIIGLCGVCNSAGHCLIYNLSLEMNKRRIQCPAH